LACGEGGPEFADGLAVLAQPVEDEPETIVRLRGCPQVSPDLDGASVLGLRLGELSLPQEEAREVVARTGIAGCELDNLAALRESPRDIALALHGVGEVRVSQGWGVIREAGQGRAELRDGLVELVLRHQDEAEVVVGIGRRLGVGVEADGLSELGSGPVELAMVPESVCELVVDGCVPRRDAEGLVVLGDGLRVPIEGE